jgi:hypothetical protein
MTFAELRREAHRMGYRLEKRRRELEDDCGLWIGAEELDEVLWRWRRGEFDEALILLGRALGEDLSTPAERNLHATRRQQ